MMKYGQFCPIAKASEVLGEKWTFLILRELLMGSCRFNELQRGLSFISPALLTRRLRSLEENGLLIRRRIQGGRGNEYFPTKASEELLPILMDLGEWGLRWAKENLTDEDYDVGFLMQCLRRSVDTKQLVGKETIIKFKFLDIKDNPDWWLIVKADNVDICLKDPGKDVNVFFTTRVKTMTQVWLGQKSYRSVMEDEEMMVVGDVPLTRSISRWLTNSPFAPQGLVESACQ